MSTLPVLHVPNGSPDASRPSLPAFESVGHRSGSQGDRPESSASGSRQSRSHGGSKDRSSLRHSLSSTANARAAAEVNGDHQYSRRASHRSSGGFLLGSIGHSTRSPQLLTKTPEDPKGKRKSEEVQLSVTKRRVRHGQTPSGSGLTGSPLATEIRPESISHAQNGTGDLIHGSGIRQSMSGPRPGTMSSGGSSGQQLELQRPSPPTFGYDTDPGQIVNMALSLSEARRRQASIKRYVSNDQYGRRIISTASSNSHRARVPSGSNAPYLTPPRPASASVSANGIAETNIVDRQKQREQHSSPSEAMEIDSPSILDEPEISEATAARVERARTYFELAYEHRRLLSHLPPVHRPRAVAEPIDPDSLTRAYNPLQYIRNRKLRIWDKSTINAEAEGWHDVDNVRSWVDTVTETHHEPRNDAFEIVRLPHLSHSESHPDESEQEGSKSRPSTQPTEQPKPRRPRSDWVTNPGDMLADCFWMEQGMNKIKIRDRDNNQMYPPDTHFRFSGWRNRTPLDVPANLQQPTPPPEEDDDFGEELPLHSPAPELPTFKSAHRTFGGAANGKKRGKIKNSVTGMEENGNRRKGLRLFMDDSSTESGSDRSPGASGSEKQRGRKRLARKRQQNYNSSGSPGEPLGTSNAKDNFFSRTLSPSPKSQPSSAPNSNRASLDQPRFGRWKRDSATGNTPLNRSQNRAEYRRPDSSTKFPSFRDRPRSSVEYDSTAPNSPVAAVWPSIAINLESPPQSRSPSPSKKKSSILNPFRDKSYGKHDKVDATDFADLSQAGLRQPGAEDKQLSDYSSTASRGTSPMTRGQSPLSKRVSLPTQSDPVPTPGNHRDSTASRVSTRSTAPSNEHSKIRGMFKGGRIAELVGNEVTRVGGFIWKRDPPSGYRRGSNDTVSTLSHGESENEDGGHANGHVYETPPRPRVRSRRASTISSKNESLTSPVSSKSPPSGERPKYNNPNLPSFTSPFERDKDTQDRKQQGLLSPTTSSEDRDHISRLAAEHRSASRSPRMDKLAPPKLDTGRATSPTGVDRKSSYGFGAGLDLARSRDASDKYNSVISEVGPGYNRGMTASGLTRASKMSIAPQAEALQQVARRDIERATALLLCSAVKAKEIGRRADMPRKQTPKYLSETMALDGSDHHHVDLSLVSRREEHVVAARIIMSRLSTQAQAFDERMRRFSSATAPALHTQLQRLEDLVDNKMTPRVRLSADEAGELSMKLSTTSTMAVKGLNDTLDGAFRRRRRGPIRWVRRLWYASIEYTVVGLLWAIWAVVSLIRIVLAVFRGTKKTARWLLWID